MAYLNLFSKAKCHIRLAMKSLELSALFSNFSRFEASVGEYLFKILNFDYYLA